MPMTITEKILAKHAGTDSVKPGDLIECNVDIALGNDITAPLAINAFLESGVKDVFDKDRVVLVPDHFTPNKDIKSAAQAKILREFARKYNITNYFEVGEMGVEHALLPEKGLVLPGDVIIGADSHTCTYGALGAFSTGVGSTDLAGTMITGKIWFKVPESIKIVYTGKLNRWVTGKDLILYTIGKMGVDGALYKSMEFCGETIEAISVDDRLAMANMAIEAGAKNGIFHVDKKTTDFIAGRAKREYEVFQSDMDANYAQVLEINCNDLEPQVAFPYLPSNARSIGNVGSIVIDQVVIGSCTNGRITDLRQSAEILKGKKVHKNIRLIIIPATQDIYKQALKEGLIEIFLDANAVVSTPTCGPCLGGHMGILAEGERAVATTNRNFVGRMGHVKSEVYLASPYIAASSAVIGKIAGPDALAGAGS